MKGIEFFVKDSNFLMLISMQHDNVNLLYLSFVLTEFIV